MLDNLHFWVDDTWVGVRAKVSFEEASMLAMQNGMTKLDALMNDKVKTDAAVSVFLPFTLNRFLLYASRKEDYFPANPDGITNIVDVAKEYQQIPHYRCYNIKWGLDAFDQSFVPTGMMLDDGYMWNKESAKTYLQNKYGFPCQDLNLECSMPPQMAEQALIQANNKGL